MKIDELAKMRCGKLLKNVDLAKYTTYKLKGKASYVIYPESVKDLKKILNFVKANDFKYKIIGNGSNLIFDEIYDGLLIKLEKLNKVTVLDTRIIAESGASLVKTAYRAAKEGLTGLEFATGIPGTIGGAVYMNAGAYNSDMGYIVSDIKVINPNGEIEIIYNRDLDFHYRHSFLQDNKDYICIEATLVLRHGDKDAIKQVIEERKQRRLLSQPLEYPSAGSVFRNPPNDFAGRLVEEAGFKGKRIGDAMVSEKHANFIINVGHASGGDIKKLILDIKTTILKNTDIDLKVEQEFVE